MINNTMKNVIKRNKFLTFLVLITFCSIFLSFYFYKSIKKELRYEIKKRELTQENLTKEKHKALERYEINDFDLLNENKRLKKELAYEIRGNLDRNQLIKLNNSIFY